MNAITLFDYWRSSASYRVRIVLNLKNVPYTRVPTSLLENEQKAPAYVARNPQGFVPMLSIDGHDLTQSLAIIDYLADKVGRDRFWPKDEVARGMARSMAAEMHAGYTALRREFPMNTRKTFHDVTISEETRKDAVRILQTWAEARSRFGKDGPYLFGTFSAADIMFAPVVTRFVTYGFTLPGFAESYAETIMAHPWMEEWYAAAAEEPWTIQRIEDAVT